MNATTTAAVVASMTHSSSTYESSQAKKLACAGYMRSYQDATATVADKQQYAECVRMIHPNEMSGGEIVFFKLMILCALIGTVFGGYKGHQEHDGIIVTVFFAVVGMLILPALVALFIGLGIGVTELF